MAKFCKNCGNQMEDEAAFCGNCGARVEVVEEAQQDNNTNANVSEEQSTSCDCGCEANCNEEAPNGVAKFINDFINKLRMNN